MRSDTASTMLERRLGRVKYAPTGRYSPGIDAARDEMVEAIPSLVEFIKTRFGAKPA